MNNKQMRRELEPVRKFFMKRFGIEDESVSIRVGDVGGLKDYPDSTTGVCRLDGAVMDCEGGIYRHVVKITVRNKSTAISTTIHEMIHAKQFCSPRWRWLRNKSLRVETFLAELEAYLRTPFEFLWYVLKTRNFPKWAERDIYHNLFELYLMFCIVYVSFVVIRTL